ncbi:MAG: aspartate kinase [SAR324 cluster bacterium]|nr:aspartate kinase [SAR324 cluster bacterium]
MTNRTIVQKFGGTSLGSPERMMKVAKIIKKSWQKQKTLVVVSAISNLDKETGTTSLLLKASGSALQKIDPQPFLALIQENHLNIINELIADSKNRQNVKNFVDKELSQLNHFLRAVEVVGELSSRSSDLILSTGERLSAMLLSVVLQSISVPARFLPLEDIIIDSGISQVNRHFHTLLRANITKRLNTLTDEVPVLTGFIGKVPGGILAGIGRGYTDFTAATVAASLTVDELQIWKDVDGVYSADPKQIKNAYVVPKLSPEEAAEITYYGAEVIHPFTIEQVIKDGIPVRIKHSLKPDLPGTVIIADAAGDEQIHNKPVAVTIKRNVQVLNIKSNRMLMAHGFMSSVFNVLNANRVVIDLIATSEVSISLTADSNISIMNAVLELKKIAEVSVLKNMAILSLVGRGMNRSVGTAAKMFSTLAKQDVNIEMITQGASEINISCVINDKDHLKALRVVHDAMLL